MKVQKLFFLLFVGVLIGFSSCKKDTPLPESATLTPTVNTKSTDINYITDQVKRFENDVINNKVRSGGCKLPVRVAMWYWENYLNLRYAYPELGGNSVKVNTTNISVQLTNGKIALDELQRVFNEVLSITANDFKMVTKYHPVSRQLNSGHFELVSSDGGNGKATVKYICAIKYDNGITYSPKDFVDDWYWGLGLGKHPNHDNMPEDATTQIKHRAITHFGFDVTTPHPLFLSQMVWINSTPIDPLCWSHSNYDPSDPAQPYLSSYEMNLYYSRFINWVQGFINNSTLAYPVVEISYDGEYGYVLPPAPPGGGGNTLTAYHVERVLKAFPIILPAQIAANVRKNDFIQ